MKTVADYIKTIPDFPKEGIMFRDVTTVFSDAEGLQLGISEMVKLAEGVEYDAVAALESRGFLFGVPIAYLQHKPFIPIRKKGKLPRKTIGTKVTLEYGEDEIEIHTEDLKPGSRVVLVDDLIATGGSLKSAIELVERLGCTVAKIIVLIELKGLNGREKIQGYDLESVIAYEGK